MILRIQIQGAQGNALLRVTDDNYVESLNSSDVAVEGFDAASLTKAFDEALLRIWPFLSEATYWSLNKGSRSNVSSLVLLCSYNRVERRMLGSASLLSVFLAEKTRVKGGVTTFNIQKTLVILTYV